MNLPNSQNLVWIARETLNRVDPRLLDHGERVAYLVYRMLQEEGNISPETLRNFVLVSLFHDIGAFKTEEIDRLVQFETSDTLNHSIYGFLFLYHMSPLKELAYSVLFHHTPFSVLQSLPVPQKKLAQMIHLADRIDILMQVEHQPLNQDFWDHHQNGQFSDEVSALMRKTLNHHPLFTAIASGAYRQELEALLDLAPFTREEIDAYLRMIVFSIDFRSYHTVTHTLTTESVSLEIAGLLGLSAEEQERIRYGALLHDLGKIAIPVEILEFPGKLSPQAMAIMRTHVTITGEILGDQIDPQIAEIALRHHEKRDGSGYPRGLTGKDLTLSQEIVAVADIVSALQGTRSYKKALGKEAVLAILTEMKETGKLSELVVDTTCAAYDLIQRNTENNCLDVLNRYSHMQRQYQQLVIQMTGL